MKRLEAMKLMLEGKKVTNSMLVIGAYFYFCPDLNQFRFRYIKEDRKANLSMECGYLILEEPRKKKKIEIVKYYFDEIVQEIAKTSYDDICKDYPEITGTLISTYEIEVEE
jgi:hypothetical protein